MVSIEGPSLKESVRGESKVRGYDDVVFEVSSESHPLGLIFLVQLTSRQPRGLATFQLF